MATVDLDALTAELRSSGFVVGDCQESARLVCSEACIVCHGFVVFQSGDVSGPSYIKGNGFRVAAIIARHLGHGPEPVAPLTDEERMLIYAQSCSAWIGATNPADAVDAVMDSILTALPNRHRRIVLGDGA